MGKVNRISILTGALALAASVAAGSAQAECYEDSFNYTWNLSEVANTSDFRRYNGTMTNSSGIFDASAVTDKRTGATAVSSNFGAAFTYLLRNVGLSVSTGSWANIVGSGGGTVSYFRECSSDSTAAAAFTAFSREQSEFPGE